jgi:aminoglycoside phosphotransferase (APT) family kinase protein
MGSAEPSLLADPAVPGLALLLDDARLRSWLDERGQHLLRRRYVRYKPGTSAVVGLQLESGGAFALAVSAEGRPKLDKLQGRAADGDMLAMDREHQVLLATVWGDRDLPALADLSRAVGRVLPAAGPHELATLVHKPQRRWVGLVHAPALAGPVLLRAYRRNRAADAAQRLKLAQHVGGAVGVPRLLGRSARYAALAVQYVPGRTLHAALATGPARSEVVDTGRALAAVHGQSPAGMPTTDLADPAATVQLVGAVLPHLRHRVDDLLVALESRRPPVTEPTVCHGDFSLDQVVVDPAGALAFVDWDRGGAGVPAADLGSAVASGLDEGTRADLFEGYTQVRPLPLHLDWYVAQAKILRLADPFRTASRCWAAQVEERVEDLEEGWA